MKFTILGGGISGLSAAHYLSKFTASEKVKVFEKVLGEKVGLAARSRKVRNDRNLGVDSRQGVLTGQNEV